MIRTLSYVVVMGLGLAGSGLAAMVLAAGHHGGERVRVIGTHEIQEKVDGHESKATVVEVTIAPGEEGMPHRHPGPALVYVLEGEYELGLDDQPTKRFRAGETFYEPAGRLHRVSRNPSKTGRTRLIAFVLHPRDIQEIAVPEKGHE